LGPGRFRARGAFDEYRCWTPRRARLGGVLSLVASAGQPRDSAGERRTAGSSATQPRHALRARAGGPSCLMNPAPLRIAHLNSLLTGGGTDDQCVKLAKGLCELGQAAWVIGPEGREFSAILRHLQVPYHPMPGEGPLKLPLMLAAAKFVRRFNIQILHAHHGRDLWPAVFAARLSARRPLLVVTRHLAKSPSSWFSRRFLLNRCDGLIAVSQFVAQVLRQGAFEPNSPEA